MISTVIQKYKNMTLAARASIWAFAASIIQKGISVAATPIFTRLLTTSEFAQYTLYQSWHDIIIIFVSLNVFNYATYTGLTKYDKDKNGFIATAQSTVTLLSVITFAVYILINSIVGNILHFGMPIVTIMFFDMLFFSSFSLWASKERMEFRYKAVTFFSVMIGVIGPTLGIIAIHYIPNKAYGRIYGVAFINIIIGLLFYVYNYAKSKKKFDRKYAKFIFAYCIPLIPHFLSTQILTRFDRVMINDICGTSEVGIYSLAYSLSSLFLIINESIFKSLTPFTYQIIKNNDNLDSLKKNVNGITVFIAVANLILILFAPEAVKLFAPDEYYQAIYIIPSVSASIYLIYLFNLFANIEYYYSETKYVTYASMMAALSNIVLNFIFIKKYGFIAAGYTTLVSYLLYAMGHYIFMKKVIKKHKIGFDYYDNRFIGIVTIIFLVLSVSIIPLYKQLLVRYIIILILGILVFLKRQILISFLVK